MIPLEENTEELFWLPRVPFLMRLRDQTLIA